MCRRAARTIGSHITGHPLTSAAARTEAHPLTSATTIGQATGAATALPRTSATTIGQATGAATAFPWTSDRSGGFISITEERGATTLMRIKP